MDGHDGIVRSFSDAFYSHDRIKACISSVTGEESHSQTPDVALHTGKVNDAGPGAGEYGEQERSRRMNVWQLHKLLDPDSESVRIAQCGMERYRSGQPGQTVNLLAYAYGGSNPPLSTRHQRGNSSAG